MHRALGPSEQIAAQSTAGNTNCKEGRQHTGASISQRFLLLAAKA
jgi:hypothetical protein